MWDEFQRLQEQMDKVFSDTGDYYPFEEKSLLPSPNKKDLQVSRYRQPLTDIFETNKDVIARLEIPGIKKEDIKIDIKDNSLKVKVERKEEKEDKKEGMYRMERRYSGFYRCFSLPENIDSNNADASYKDGVLEIKIPKTEVKEPETKSITVK